MIRKLKMVLIPVLSLALAACATAPADDATSRTAISSRVSWERVRADMIALSTDEMGGRAAGSAGYDRAAAFVAERFEALGLRPVGASYLQPAHFVESRVVDAALSISAMGGPLQLAFREDFVTGGGFGSLSESVTAPLVFVGHGVSAPQLGHDDYAEIDVRGRIVVVLNGAPPTLGTSERAFHSSLSGKLALAEERGAVGLLLVHTPVDRQRLTWPQVVRGALQPDLRWRTEAGVAHEGFAAVPQATLSPRGAERLFAASAIDLDTLFDDYARGAVRSFPLDATATFNRTSMQTPTSSPNIAGVLPGSDLALRHEILLITAHLDHLGIDAEGDGDRIFNGAYDNAAGVAVMMEIARTLAPSRLRRTVMFVALTAEEHGLRGSDYFAHHPPAPIESFVANLNIDMPYLGFPIRDVEGYGAAHSTLEDSLAVAARETGLSVTPDPRPELVRLIRSDQYSFVRRGIPGMNLKPGSTSADAPIDGPAVLQDFLSRHYHRPSDDASLPFNRDAAQAFTRTAVTLSLLIANADERPRWRENDFFAARFARR